MLHPISQLSDTSIAYLPAFRKRSFVLYWIVIFIVTGTLCSFPFIYTTISVKALGITRPLNERTEVKPVTGGIIDEIYFTEGRSVQKDNVVLRIKDNSSAPKINLSNYETLQRQQFIHDLEILTHSDNLTESSVNSLQSPVYKQQISRFVYQKSEQEASLKKVKQELHIDSLLLKDKVIAPKEMFDKVVENEKLHAAYSAFKNDQISAWQQELSKYKLELSQLTAQRLQITEDAKLYEVKAPVSGIVQGINTKYAGGIVQAGETICTISPETDVIAECYVNTQDAGLLKLNQEARFQIDAFDYNYFGIVTGKILNIDNDFTVVDNRPVFKVRCSFDTKQLHLKNGFNGELKKGLTFQVRFVVRERSLWQLLWDKMDDWLNPASPAKKFEN